jgi:hypothetical protein
MTPAIIINLVGFVVVIVFIVVSQERNASVAKRVAEDARLVALEVRAKLVVQEERLAEALKIYHTMIERELKGKNELS